MADPTAGSELTFNFNEASVLIVDENAGFMDVTTLMLSSFGFRKLHRCQSLGESHAFSQDVEADLILVDPFPRADEGLALIRDLRAMGETNALAGAVRPLTRGILARAAQLYGERFGEPDGRTPATFEIVHLAGWAPHESQQKPLPRGSAKMRLADALGVKEMTGDEID